MTTTAEDPYVAWCRGIRRSDRAAFEALFRAAYPGLCRYARRFTTTDAAAEDVVQEAFLRIWRRRATLDPERSLRALLYVSVRHLAMNERDKHRREQPLEPALYEAPHPADPGAEADAALLGAHFRAWIEALPEKRREAFRLSRFARLSYAEIAQVMGLSAKTVENHIRLALRDLRDKLREHEPSLLER